MSDHEYSEYHDGPEAKMARDAARAEARRLEVVDRLLDSLRPEDATRQLFSFTEIEEFKLRRHAKKC